MMRTVVLFVTLGVLVGTLGARPLIQVMSFEVAAIKPLNIQIAPDPYSAPVKISGTNVSFRGNIVGLALTAYNLKYYQFGGGAPTWATTELYDVAASSSFNNPTLDQSRHMLQALLIERCQLKVHRETRQIPIYDLVVDGSGLKLKPPKPGIAPKRQQVGIHYHIVNPDVTSDDIAMLAAGFLESAVLDKTGLPGHYSLDFEVDRDGSIFSAIKQQLGLKLVSAREVLEVMVIDNVVRPSPN
jgi:uncharacterized protein (TIGR03435 family)